MPDVLLGNAFYPLNGVGSAGAPSALQRRSGRRCRSFAIGARRSSSGPGEPKMVGNSLPGRRSSL